MEIVGDFVEQSNSDNGKTLEIVRDFACVMLSFFICLFLSFFLIFLFLF